MKKIDEPVVIEQTFSAPIDSVWKSITETDQMRQWFFENIPSFIPEVGFETQFDVKSQDRNFRHIWKVTEVVPPKKIVYGWKYDGYSGDSLVMFELSEQDDLTKLTLTHRVLESFSEEIPEFRRENCVGGWTFFIKENLRKYLEVENRR